MKDIEKDLEEFYASRNASSNETSSLNFKSNIDKDLEEFYSSRKSDYKRVFNPVNIEETITSTQRPYDKEGIISDVIVEPVMDVASEVSRGALTSTASTLDKIQAATDIIKGLTSFDVDSGGGLKAVSDRLKEYAAQIPQTPNPVLAFGSQLVGSIPAMALEFAGTKNPVGLAAGGVGFAGKAAAFAKGNMSFIGRSALLGALDEYYKDPNASSFIQGGVQGAAIGGAISLTPNLLQKGAELTRKYGSKVARQYIKTVTNMADDDVDYAMKNLDKFNTNPTKKRLNLSKEIKEADESINSIKSQQKTEIELKKNEIDETIRKASLESKDRIQAIVDENRRIIDDFSEKTIQKKEALSRTRQTSMENLADSRSSSIADATVTLENNIVKAKSAAIDEAVAITGGQRILLDSQENALKQAINVAKTSLEKNGLDYVPINIVKSRISAVLNKHNKIFTKENKRILEKEFSLIDDIKATVDDFAGSKNISTQALDAMESRLQQSIGTVNDRTRQAFQDLADSVRLSKLADDVPHLAPIKRAREEFANNVDEYRKLSQSFSKQEILPDGQIVNSMDIDKVAKAFLNTQKSTVDRQVLNSIRKADSLLPEKERIFGKLESVFNNYKRIEELEKTGLSTLQKQLKSSRIALQSKFEKLQSNLNSELRQQRKNIVEKANLEKRRLTREEEDALYNLKKSSELKVDELKIKQNAELSQLQSVIDERLKFIKTQEILRSFRPPTEAYARSLQNIAGGGAFFSTLSGNIGAAVPAAIGAASMSPLVASNLIKAGSKVPKVLDKASKLAERKLLKQLIAQQTINN